ncbi:MAG TPA: hypothetical protein VFE61_25350 [Candidatus Sulfotelmatobacter sp.]|nr:hypothetical protein [Candidatus Sulfotelmatobacter sp.]
MSSVIEIAAEAERPEVGASAGFPRQRRNDPPEEEVSASELPTAQFPEETPAAAESLDTGDEQQWGFAYLRERDEEQERQRRIYRAKTVAMLRRDMRHSIETGRLPSVLGKEFFRAKVTAHTAVTFEDRVIFVVDMERCLARLDEFSRQLIARHILQEHDRWATARLLNCNEKTIRRYTPVVLDLLSEILFEVGLMERVVSNWEKPCQGVKRIQIAASDCDDGK